jgi:large subunit ribosomal protein L21
MYAIIKTGGKQYWVTPGEIIQVEKLKAETGKDVTFSALWSASNNPEEKVQANKNAKVTATVLRHIKSPKTIVFKKRPKKAYEKSFGHRQELSEIQIKEIQLS